MVVKGELDMASAPDMTSAIESLARSDAQRVVVDLGGVSFIDSSGMGALCLCAAKLEAAGAVLVLGPTSAQVAAVLQMAGLECQFPREAGPP